MAQHNETGRWGEQMAVDYLVGKGYIIREQNWRFSHYEIDIIALSPDGFTLAFIEVKTRDSDEVLDPMLAVDRKKMTRLRKAANAYVIAHENFEELCFDIITIIGNATTGFRVEHAENAYNPLLIF